MATKTLHANSGMWLYDGHTFVKVIHLSNESEENKWQQVSQEFYDEKNPKVEESEIPEVPQQAEEQATE